MDIDKSHTQIVNNNIITSGFFFFLSIISSFVMQFNIKFLFYDFQKQFLLRN